MQRRFGLVLVVVALLAAACGGGDDTTKTSTSKDRKATTSTTSESAESSELETAGPTTTAGASSGPAATTATTKPSTSSGPATGGSVVAPGGVPAPAANGTYDYSQSGSTSQGAVPPNGTLVVSGSSPQTLRRYVNPEEPPSDIIYEFRPEGPFITRVVVRYSIMEIACSFASPVPAPPWPPTTGKTFSGTATCNGGFTATFSGKISGKTTDTVAGTKIEAIVINSTLNVKSQNVDIKVTDTQHWAESLRVPTYSREVINGTAFGSPISGDVTSKLTSPSPR